MTTSMAHVDKILFFFEIFKNKALVTRHNIEMSVVPLCTCAWRPIFAAIHPWVCAGCKWSEVGKEKDRRHVKKLVYLRNVLVLIFANIGNHDKCDLVLGELGCGSRTR